MKKILKQILIFSFVALAVPNTFGMKKALCSLKFIKIKKLFGKKKTVEPTIKIVKYCRHEHGLKETIPRVGDFYEGEFHLEKNTKINLVLKDGESAGYVVYCRKREFCPGEESKQIGFISSIKIFDRFQEQGLSRILLGDALDKLFKEKVVYTKLFTYLQNTAAMNLYQSMGFKPKKTGRLLTPLFLEPEAYQKYLQNPYAYGDFRRKKNGGSHEK